MTEPEFAPRTTSALTSPGANAPQTVARIPKSLFGILLLFGLSRAYYQSQGVEFDDVHLRISWQILDPELLRENLFQCLWNLHAQPPLFNFFSGLAVKLAPDIPSDILNPVFILLGLLNLITMDAIMRRLDIYAGLRWFVLTLSAFNPSFILVENFYLYTHPLTCMMTFATWGWMKLYDERKLRHAVLVFVLLFTMAMMRSLFHLSWYVVIGATAVALFGAGRRKIASIVAVPGLIIVLWYLKTLIMFGTFGASTWLGMSIAKTTTFQLSQEERESYIAKGVLSPVAAIMPFSKFSWYRDYLKETKTGIPVLDLVYNESGSVNFNNLAMIELCEMYKRDAFWTLRHHPMRFLGSQRDSWANYFETTSCYQFLQINRSKIVGIDEFYNNYIYFQHNGPARANTQPGTFISFFQPSTHRPFAPMLVVLFMVTAVWLPIRYWQLQAEGNTFAEGAAYVFIWLNVMYVSCAGNFLEIGENNRFRFMIEPVSWIALAAFVTWCLKQVMKKKSRTAEG